MQAPSKPPPVTMRPLVGVVFLGAVPPPQTSKEPPAPPASTPEGEPPVARVSMNDASDFAGHKPTTETDETRKDAARLALLDCTGDEAERAQRERAYAAARTKVFRSQQRETDTQFSAPPVPAAEIALRARSKSIDALMALARGSKGGPTTTTTATATAAGSDTKREASKADVASKERSSEAAPDARIAAMLLDSPPGALRPEIALLLDKTAAGVSSSSSSSKTNPTPRTTATSPPAGAAVEATTGTSSSTTSATTTRQGLTVCDRLGMQGATASDHGHLGGLLAGKIGSNRFQAQYAVDGRAKCRHVKCGKHIACGELRIGKIPPSVKTGHSARTHWYHVACIFRSFRCVCRGTKTITSTDDVENFDRLLEFDRDKLRAYVHASNAGVALSVPVRGGPGESARNAAEGSEVSISAAGETERDTESSPPSAETTADAPSDSAQDGDDDRASSSARGAPQKRAAACGASGKRRRQRLAGVETDELEGIVGLAMLGSNKGTNSKASADDESGGSRRTAPSDDDADDGPPSKKNRDGDEPVTS